LEDEADKSGNNATKIWEWKKNKKASYLETAHWLSTYACVNLSDGWANLSLEIFAIT